MIHALVQLQIHVAKITHFQKRTVRLDTFKMYTSFVHSQTQTTRAINTESTRQRISAIYHFIGRAAFHYIKQ